MSARRGYVIALPLAIALFLGVGVLGYFLGHRHRAVFMVGPGIVYATPSEGTAYLGAHQPLNREATGFAYAYPPTEMWIGADGSENQGSRPPCVPYYHPVRVKNMEVVQVPLPGGGYTGTVLWVQC
jgi:hypothetical protein